MADVCVDLGSSIGVISPFIYGHFIEHLGAVIYDGIWVGPESKVENVNGIRRQLVEKLAEVRPPVIRWPGGCFADAYHWRDGVGPREGRPRRYGRWKDAVEPNLFGTHEFIDFCRLVGAEPYIVANVGTGSPREFHEWVEYCNAPRGSTSLAEEREANGSPEPFNVRFWGVGNEVWGCGGTMSPEYYAELYRRFTTWLPGFGLDLFLIACGPHSGIANDWTRRFFRAYHGAGGVTRIDGWAYHYYISSGRAVGYSRHEWYELLSKAAELERLIDEQWRLLGLFDRDRRIRLVFDEWGVWHPSGSELRPGHLLGEALTIRDALATAIQLDVFNRCCDKVFMANVAQLVNCLNSLFAADGEELVSTSVYHVFRMYRDHQGGKSVRLIPEAGLAGILGSASVKEGVLTVTLVNQHLGMDAEVEIKVKGGEVYGGEAETLTCDDIYAYNSFKEPDRVKPSSLELKVVDGGVIKAKLPRASVNKFSLLIDQHQR